MNVLTKTGVYHVEHMIIFNPYNLWDFHLNYEIPIYHNLLSRGIKPIYVRCGLDHAECDLYWLSASGPRPQNACVDCKFKTDQYLTAGGIDYQSLSDFIDPQGYEGLKQLVRMASYENLRKVEILGFQVYELAISSVFTHFRINEFDPQNSEQLACLREYMIYAVGVLLAGTLMLERYRPKTALTFNGRTAPTRAFMELCRRHGVRVTTHERGITRGGLILIANSNCLSFVHFMEISQKTLHAPLKPYQVSLVSNWLRDRRVGRNLNWKHFQIEGISAPRVESPSGLSEWVLFTSSMDELSSSDEFSSPFENQYNWIEQTCRIALSLQDKVRLTIRVHPNSSSAMATGVNREEQSYFMSLKASMEGKPIRIIESGEPVDSYSLLDNADLVLAYATSMSIEALLSGKPTYLAANSPFVWCPGLMSYKSHPDYSALLHAHSDKGQFGVSSTDLAQGFRFAYHWLFNYQIIFSFLHQTSKGTNRLVVSDAGDFAQGMYPELDRAVETVLGQIERIEIPLGYYDEACIQVEAQEIQLSFRRQEGPLFSVVITNYNYRDYLKNCVESVIAQNDPTCEIIIVDDGSTDGSQVVIEELIRDYPKSNIIPLLQENSGQPAIARNNGIRIASGRFILPLDADDMIANGYLSGCRQIIADRAEVNLIAANCIMVHPEREAELSKPGLFNTGRLAKNNQIVVASVYAKTLWQKVGGYRENVRGYEDWDMWLNMSMNGAITAYFDGIGLVYNAKDTGLYHDAKKRHDNLYANIILNNRDAYQGNMPLVRWAERLISQDA